MQKISALWACSSVDRVSDSDPDGRGFNSLHAQHFPPNKIKKDQDQPTFLGDCKGIDT